MRVILELRTGPHAGRKTWLQAGQTLQVGNTEDADFVVADDVEMSNVHFSIATNPAGCRLTDLQSEHGTFVNGERVQQTQLSDGDEIEAGASVLRVKIDGVRPAAAAVTPPTMPATTAPVIRAEPSRPQPVRREPVREAVRSRAAVDDGPVRYKREEGGSGLVHLSAIDAKDDPIRVARRLAKAAPLYLVLDRAKLDLTPPVDIKQPEYLLDWLPEAARAAASPVVLRPGETAEWPQIIGEAWGKGGMVCMFSRLKSEEMLKSLRRAAQINPMTGVEFAGEASLQYWQPDLIRLVLMHSPSDYLGALLDAIDAVLVEGPEGEGWQIFAQAEFAGQLDGHGFVNVTTAKER